MAKKHGIQYIETSARSGQNVNDAFTKISKIVEDRVCKSKGSGGNKSKYLLTSQLYVVI